MCNTNLKEHSTHTTHSHGRTHQNKCLSGVTVVRDMWRPAVICMPHSLRLWAHTQCGHMFTCAEDDQVTFSVQDLEFNGLFLQHAFATCTSSSTGFFCQLQQLFEMLMSEKFSLNAEWVCHQLSTLTQNTRWEEASGPKNMKGAEKKRRETLDVFSKKEIMIITRLLL